MMTINEIQDEIIEEFDGLDDWMDRYQLLIDLGNDLEPLPEQYKTEQNLIDGCQSRVWLQADLQTSGNGDGRKVIVFRAESDALIVKGIVSLLIRVQRPHTAGGARCRPLLHQPHRTARAPLADALQRPAGHGAPDEGLRHGLRCQALTALQATQSLHLAVQPSAPQVLARFVDNDATEQ